MEPTPAIDPARVHNLSDRARELLDQRTREVVDALDRVLGGDAKVPPGEDAAQAFAAFRAHFRERAAAEVGVRCLGALTRALRIDEHGTAEIDEAAWVADVQVNAAGVLTEVFDDGLAPEERRAGRAAVVCSVIRGRAGKGLVAEEAAYVEAVAQRFEEVGVPAVSEQELRTLEHLLVKTEPMVEEMGTDEGRATILADQVDKARAALARVPLDPPHPALEGLDAAFAREFLQRLDADLQHQAVSEVNRLCARVAEWDESERCRGLAREICELVDGGTPAEDLDIFPRELESCREVAASAGVVDSMLRGDVERARARFEVEQ